MRGGGSNGVTFEGKFHGDTVGNEQITSAALKTNRQQAKRLQNIL